MRPLLRSPHRTCTYEVQISVEWGLELFERREAQRCRKGQNQLDDRHTQNGFTKAKHPQTLPIKARGCKGLSGSWSTFVRW